MQGPLTLEDTIYAKTFPTHQEVCDFILKLPNKPIYVKSAEECDRVCAEFERNGMLGFDMEWNKLPSPGRQRPPGPIPYRSL